jgi:hypothetical protein
VGVLLLHSLCTSSSFGWGWDAHRFINRNSVYHLPGEMALLVQDSTFLALHSVDADARKISGDTSLFAEGPRHYLDIDDYPDFHALPRKLDSIIALYGWERVKQNGTLPWATVMTYDSLIAQLSRGDWSAALLSASDLGHYVADAHQPLHCTVNYNGQLTDNDGIHSRYETTMLSSTYYLSELWITPDSARYVSDPLAYAFEYILHANSLLDTILLGDTYARNVSGWGGSGSPPASYYAALWEKTRHTTLDQLQRATEALASLWYSAWVDAGLLSPTEVTTPKGASPEKFLLFQNFPNPFNPHTEIRFQLEEGSPVRLAVYDLAGREIAVLADGVRSAGIHTVRLDGSGFASGVYLYRLSVRGAQTTRAMLLVR